MEFHPTSLVSDNGVRERRSDAWKRVQVETQTPMEPKYTKPKTLLLTELHQEPLIFQQRELSEDNAKGTIKYNVETLNHQLRFEEGNKLDPILVWWSGHKWTVLDGHHRIEAYKQFLKEERRPEGSFKVPVNPFKGTLDEALAKTAVANKKFTEPLTTTEKADAMWRIICVSYIDKAKWSQSKAELKAMGLVASNTISRMRSVLGQLYDKGSLEWINPMDMTWREAQEFLQGGREVGEFSFDKQEELICDWTDRLGRTFKDAPTKNPDAFMEALERYSPQLMDRIRSTLQEDTFEDECGDECGDDAPF